MKVLSYLTNEKFDKDRSMAEGKIQIDLDRSITEGESQTPEMQDSTQNSELDVVKDTLDHADEIDSQRKDDNANALSELREQIQQIREERCQVKKSYVSVVSSDSTFSANSNRSTTSGKVPSRQPSSSSDKTVNIISSADRNRSSLSATNETSSKKPVKGSPGSVGRNISTIRKNVLLTGDSIINRVNPRGLKYNVHKHAIPGATIQTLMAEIQLFDLSKFDTIIMYVGGNDLANHQDIELIEEHFDQFVAILKASNPRLRVVLSTVAPRGDIDVSPLNSVIQRLCTHHELESVDIFRAFHDNNGMVCMRYMNHQDPVHPSASRIKRVLGTKNNKINIVNNFDTIVFSQVTQRKPFRTTVRYAHGQHSVRLGQSSMITPRTCLKCGESNHETSRCRHQTPVTCWACGNTGHKQGHCEFFK